MVLTKEELITSLQNEVRILLHLASKIDRSQLDYRPTPKQRSTIELLRYLTIMGPNLIPAIKTGAFDGAAFGAAQAAANAMNFDQVLAAIEKQSDDYAQQTRLRSRTPIFAARSTCSARKPAAVRTLCIWCSAGSRPTARNCSCTLKACGRDELNTMNLWGGMDAPMQG